MAGAGEERWSAERLLEALAGPQAAQVCCGARQVDGVLDAGDPANRDEVVLPDFVTSKLEVAAFDVIDGAERLAVHAENEHVALNVGWINRGLTGGWLEHAGLSGRRELRGARSPSVQLPFLPLRRFYRGGG